MVESGYTRQRKIGIMAHTSKTMPCLRAKRFRWKYRVADMSEMHDPMKLMKPYVAGNGLFPK